MKRKLVKQGAATLMISLPANWIKANHLDKGDEVDIGESNNDLVIKPGSLKKEKKEISLSIDGNNFHDLRVLLTHAYRKGFDRITLKGNTSSFYKETSEVCSRVLLGFEIIERTKDKIVLENISIPDSSKYSSILSKVFVIISEIQDMFINNNLNYGEIRDTKDQSDKFILFCRRIIFNKQINLNPILEWEFLTFLTHIQHRYFYLAEYILKNKIKLDKEIINLFVASKEYFSLFDKAYNEKDIVPINKINSLKNKYQYGLCLELLNKSKGNNSIVLAYITEIFRLIQIGTSPILSMRLEQEN